MVSYQFLQEVPSEIKINVKKGMYFSLGFGWYSIYFNIVRKNMGGGFFFA